MDEDRGRAMWDLIMRLLEEEEEEEEEELQKLAPSVAKTSTGMAEICTRGLSIENLSPALS
jgi:hypothetical protein